MRPVDHTYRWSVRYERKEIRIFGYGPREPIMLRVHRQRIDRIVDTCNLVRRASGGLALLPIGRRDPVSSRYNLLGGGCGFVRAMNAQNPHLVSKLFFQALLNTQPPCCQQFGLPDSPPAASSHEINAPNGSGFGNQANTEMMPVGTPSGSVANGHTEQRSAVLAITDLDFRTVPTSNHSGPRC